MSAVIITDTVGGILLVATGITLLAISWIGSKP